MSKPAFPGIEPIRYQPDAPANAAGVPLLRQGQERPRQAHGGSPPHGRLLLAHVRVERLRRVRRRHVRPHLAPRAATPWSWPRRRRPSPFELFEKLGVPFFCFHDRDVAPEGRTLAETNDILDKLDRRARSADEADRHEAAVGHGEPVLAPALHGRRRHQPRSRGVRLRRGAGEEGAGGHPAARRRQLRPVGRPRGLRDAAQHRHEARARPARALHAPGRRAQAQDRLQGAAADRAEAARAHEAPVRLRHRDGATRSSRSTA